MDCRYIVVVIQSEDGNAYDLCDVYEVVPISEENGIDSYQKRPSPIRKYERSIHVGVNRDMSVRVISDNMAFACQSVTVDDNYGQQLIWDIDCAFQAFDVARAAAFPAEYRKWESRRAADSHKIGEDEKTPVEIVLPAKEQMTFPHSHEERG